MTQHLTTCNKNIFTKGCFSCTKCNVLVFGSGCAGGATKLSRTQSTTEPLSIPRPFNAFTVSMSGSVNANTWQSWPQWTTWAGCSCVHFRFHCAAWGGGLVGLGIHTCRTDAGSGPPPLNNLTFRPVGGRAFPVAGAKVLNGLPSEVTSASSLLVFKNRLKTYLFRRCYETVWL